MFKRIAAAAQRVRLSWILADVRRSDPEGIAELDRIVSRYTDGGGLDGSPSRQLKLWELSNLLESEYPENCLELGSGSTTPILADFAARTGHRLTSVDESERWLDHSRSLCSEEAKRSPQVRFVLSDRSFENGSIGVGGAVRYSEDLAKYGPFDFVLIDGPSFAPTANGTTAEFNSDIFHIEDSVLPRVIVVDVRLRTVAEIERRLGEFYHVTPSTYVRVLGGFSCSGFSYFSVFRRRDGPRSS
jgi:SAM-dependent methyltransferase